MRRFSEYSTCDAHFSTSPTFDNNQRSLLSHTILLCYFPFCMASVLGSASLDQRRSKPSIRVSATGGKREIMLAVDEKGGICCLQQNRLFQP